MKVVILGATGTTGSHVVDDALEEGYEVIAYVRDPSAMIPRKNLTIIAGSVEDEHAMRAAFEGADAVISCLGLRPSLKSIFKETDFQQKMLPKVISAINNAGVKRFVLMSSFGVGETRTKSSFIPRVIFHTVFGGRLFADKALAENALPACKANWTAIYPVTLNKGPAEPMQDLVPLNMVHQVPGIPVLSFATVARTLVSLITNENLASQKMLLTTKGGWR